MDTITIVDDPRTDYRPVSPFAEQKVLTALDCHRAVFIQLSPLLVIATAGLDADARDLACAAARAGRQR